MSQQPPNKNTNSQQPNKEVPTHLIEVWVETQKQQVLNQAQELRLKEKELEVNARLAEQQMTLQAGLLKDKPAQQRKLLQ